MKRIGILGGTFDPPHMGHLVIAEEVRLALELDEIWLVPSFEPPHKDTAKSDSTDRLEMAKRAIQGNPAFKINTIEVDRIGKSYTFDTMKALTSEFPHTDFYFIIGADMVEFLPHWKNIKPLMELVKFVGVQRKGYQLETDLPVEVVDIPMIEISSTMIRQRLSDQGSVKYLVPDTVESYIKEKHLYEN
ncbi:nicotinate-nucleotide adenylyltransferase [Virgibacillus ihumii]|uniref:nicotinate-nucleotide adenylyltransferase n=1 Tax=Virgibacillus ihumii TaxID=2686091 RepID=UPI00157BCE44|nr:nicotinate-nucleotide adenylyltransferase [Virgibacillus ihumii]